MKKVHYKFYIEAVVSWLNETSVLKQTICAYTQNFLCAHKYLSKYIRKVNFDLINLFLNAKNSFIKKVQKKW